MNVMVAGYRNLLEPAVLGDCEDPECITVAATGELVLIVASYRLAGLDPMRVCATCDERILRRWIADDEEGDR